MNRAIQHVVIAAIVPATFFAIAATPVEVIGCRNRGLLALLVVFIGLLGAAGVAVLGIRRKVRGGPESGWRAASIALLIIPAIALIFLA